MALAPGGYVAPGAYHALGLAVDVPVHGALVVLHADPVALLMADPVFNAIERAFLEETDQRLAHPAQIIRMHPGSEGAEHGDLALLGAEDRLAVGGVHETGPQIPLPEARGPGLGRHAQAGLRLMQFGGARCDPVRQGIGAVARLLLRLPAGLDLAGRL